MKVIESDVKIEYLTDKKSIDNEWDNFIDSLEGDIHQTSGWAKYELETKGWQSFRFYVKNKNEIIGGCKISIINIANIIKVGYVQYGPFVKLKTLQVYDIIAKEIKNFTKKHHLLYSAIAPNFSDEAIIGLLESNNFHKKERLLPPDIVVDTTLMLNLDLSIEDIFNQMKDERKKKIRKGLKAPFNVRIGNKDDLKSFFELSTKTSSKFDNTPMIDSLDKLHSLWDAFSEKERIALFLGEVEEKVICACLVFIFGNTFSDYYWGWNGEYSKYEIPSVIRWKTIQWAKEKSLKHYDFIQLDRESTNAILSSEPIPESIKNRSFFGPTFFKLKFGGNIVSYPDSYVYYPNKLKFILVHKIGIYLIKNMSLNSIIGFMYKLTGKRKIK